MLSGRYPVIPDFSPVTAEQVREHLDACPGCQGRMNDWCEVGKDLFGRFSEQSRQESARHDDRQAWELIREGWKFELPDSIDPDVMSWYWRSPSKRKGSKGKFHHSTNQAWRAMKRGKGEDPDGQE